MTQPFLLTDDPLPNGTLIEASAGTGKTYSVAAIVTQAIAIDDDLRPISMAELKKQAMRQIDTDKNFRMLRASAAMASAAMITHSML